MFRRSPKEASDEEPHKPTPLPWPGVPMSLRVADGFKFGCGLMLAGATGLVLVLLLIAVAIMAARFAGNDISLPSPGAALPTPVERPPLTFPTPISLP
jgi:hypothetical protein